jgi:hypothetical protein
MLLADVQRQGSASTRRSGGNPNHVIRSRSVASGYRTSAVIGHRRSCPSRHALALPQLFGYVVDMTTQDWWAIAIDALDMALCPDSLIQAALPMCDARTWGQFLKLNGSDDDAGRIVTLAGASFGTEIAQWRQSTHTASTEAFAATARVKTALLNAAHRVMPGA